MHEPTDQNFSNSNFAELAIVTTHNGFTAEYFPPELAVSTLHCSTCQPPAAAAERTSLVQTNAAAAAWRSRHGCCCWALHCKTSKVLVGGCARRQRLPPLLGPLGCQPHQLPGLTRWQGWAPALPLLSASSPGSCCCARVLLSCRCRACQLRRCCQAREASSQAGT